LPVPSSVPVPSCAVPSEKATDPLGVPLPDTGATRAAKVRFVPGAAVELDAVSVVVVAIVTGEALTVRGTAEEVLAAKLESLP
jgi:hypothetical protein